MALLQLQGLTVAFGGPPVLDQIDLQVDAGERLALLGRNGAGKSTLMRVIAGVLEPDDGTIVTSPGFRAALLPQQVPRDLPGTVREVVAGGTREGARRIEAVISRVGLDPEAPVATLSAGLKRRTLLARALASDPDLLLLDEPTNHLDVASITWLEDLLRRDGRALLFVTHDRAFLRRLATGILDLDRGRLTRWPGDYDRYREVKSADLDAEARADALFDKRKAEEEAWIRQGVRERRKRNQGRVGRLQAMREALTARRTHPGTVRMEVQSAAPSGRTVIRAKGLGFAWAGQPIVEDLTTTIQRGDRVGIVGPNGSGKTTLLRLLLGELEPTAGEVLRGTNVEIGYFDQLHAQLDDDATLADAVTDGRPTVTVNGKTRQVVGYLRDFLFTPDQARHPVRLLSGGERNRLLLARLFARPSNLLVLDEPTNDLDMETLEVLEDLLGDYDGTVLLVSHDRELLDDVVTSTLLLEGDGKVGEYVGGWTDLVRQRAEREPSAPKKERKADPRQKAPRPVSRLTKAEKQELHALPGRIEALEAERDALHEAMADPAFYQRDGDAIAEARARLAALEADLASAYDRWQHLEAEK